jgi:SAM-dependent methyltransferase
MRWLMPNWRERLACEHCQLNNRMRAALHYLLAFGQPLPWEPLYITEQSTPLFTALRTLVPGAMGSEFLGPSTPTGTIDARGLRNESLTRLTFEDARFRFLLTFDVLEHVPDTAAALGECARVLQPGGWLILTAPFDVHRESTLRRASLHPDGGVVHHVEPEYHGDPLNPEGILSYFTFGWDLLEGLASHGFERPRAFVYWSEELGYLGESQVIVSARRAPR